MRNPVPTFGSCFLSLFHFHPFLRISTARRPKASWDTLPHPLRRHFPCTRAPGAPAKASGEGRQAGVRPSRENAAHRRSRDPIVDFRASAAHPEVQNDGRSDQKSKQPGVWAHGRRVHEEPGQGVGARLRAGVGDRLVSAGSVCPLCPWGWPAGRLASRRL